MHSLFYGLSLKLRPVLAVVGLAALLSSCREAGGTLFPCREVSAVKATNKGLQHQLVLSSELVPFQQIDIFANEAGALSKVNVDTGSHVRAGQVMAVLDLPELQMELDEDDADIAAAAEQIGQVEEELDRIKGQQALQHSEFTRLDAAAKSQPGLLSQQEVDDARGKDLASEVEVEAAQAMLQSAQSRLARAQSKRRHDQAALEYAKIVAPFDGVVTQRYANVGAFMQPATNSGASTLPLLQLSEEDTLRLIIRMPDSYAGHIHIGDAVDVRVPRLDRHFRGRVAGFQADAQTDPRNVRTEVDVPNPRRVLTPGIYAEATLILDQGLPAVTVPLDAVDGYEGRRTIWVIDGWSKAELRNVAISLETPQDAAVLSGVQEGEWVAVGDRSGLRAGEMVCRAAGSRLPARK